MIPTCMFCDASQSTQKDENKIVGCAQTSTDVGCETVLLFENSLYTMSDLFLQQSQW